MHSIGYKRLRGGGGPLILSLGSGDFVISVLHILPAYSSFQGKWSFGSLGCSLYAGAVGLSGLASLFTLSVIAADRFSIIVGRPLTWITGKKTCVVIWTLSFCLILPPFLGWSRYCEEGLGTSCSWDYKSRDIFNRLYYIFILTFGFALPVSVIIVSYIGIFHIVYKQSVLTSRVSKNELIICKKSPTKTDIKAAQVVFTIIVCFLVSWSPYAIVSLIGQFGDPGFLSPLSTAMPAVFAKASVIFNPIVYGLSHPHFRSAVRTLQARRWKTKQSRHPHINNNGHSLHYPRRLYGYQFNTAPKKQLNYYNVAGNGSRERLRRELRNTRERQGYCHHMGSTNMCDHLTGTGTCHNTMNSRLGNSVTTTIKVTDNCSLIQTHILILQKASFSLPGQDSVNIIRIDSHSHGLNNNFPDCSVPEPEREPEKNSWKIFSQSSDQDEENGHAEIISDKYIHRIPYSSCSNVRRNLVRSASLSEDGLVSELTRERNNYLGEPHHLSLNNSHGSELDSRYGNLRLPKSHQSRKYIPDSSMFNNREDKFKNLDSTTSVPIPMSPRQSTTKTRNALDKHRPFYSSSFLSTGFETPVLGVRHGHEKERMTKGSNYFLGLDTSCNSKRFPCHVHWERWKDNPGDSDLISPRPSNLKTIQKHLEIPPQQPEKTRSSQMNISICPCTCTSDIRNLTNGSQDQYAMNSALTTSKDKRTRLSFLSRKKNVPRMSRRKNESQENKALWTSAYTVSLDDSSWRDIDGHYLFNGIQSSFI